MRPTCYPVFPFDNSETRQTHWVCVRTRPQWEKRFAKWLKINQLAHYLPTYQHRTTSYRKTRTTQLPLFPGYVFVEGNYTKGDFCKSDSVVRVLPASCHQERIALHQQLRQLWIAENAGLPMRPVPIPQKGQQIEVREGILKGMVGIFQKQGRNDTLVLTVDMIGVAVTVEMNSQYRYQILTTP